MDFCIVRGDRIDSAVEVKLSDETISQGLRYFCEKYGIQGIQCVKHLRQERREGMIELRTAVRYLEELFM